MANEECELSVLELVYELLCVCVYLTVVFCVCGCVCAHTCACMRVFAHVQKSFCCP